MDIKKQLENALREAAGSFVKDLSVEPEVSVNSDLSKGDFSTNFPLVVFSKNKKELKSPIDLGERLAEILKKEPKITQNLQKIEAVKPGFINFWLSAEALEKGIGHALTGLKNKPQSREILFEFGDPNPFKEPHIGHLRNFILGESIARLLEYEGAKVHRLDYQGDVGLHVAKALWGLYELYPVKQGFGQFAEIDELPLDERARILSKAYVKGAAAFEASEGAKKEIAEINNKLYQKDPQLIELWEKGRRWSLDYFEELYKKMGIDYEKYYFESVTAPEGFGLVRKYPDVFVKDAGAYIFRGEDYGLHTRVFVTKDGYATYEAKDLALAHLKDKDFGNYDLSIVMTANEQIEYFKVLLKALSLVNKKIGDRTRHLSFGFVNLKDGKMSSRLGNVVSAFWLLDEVSKKLEKGFKKVEKGVLEDLATGSVKWAILKFSRESNIAFDIDESVDLAGNSGPYMMYTYARISSILNKSSITDFEANSVKSPEGFGVALVRLVCQFDYVVFSAAHTYSPNILTNYLFELAKVFNQFYEKEKIIGSDKEEEKVVLSAATGQVLKKGLELLGISAPEKI